jgi:cytochrome c-type biogenesis protein
MSAAWIALASAAWLGVLTSVSPCPLATNIAATSLLARRASSVRRALVGAAAYTGGRVAVYVLLASLLSFGLASAPDLAAFLRQHVLPLIGPVLVLGGMAVLGLLPLPLQWRIGSSESVERMSRWGPAGEFLIGALFALSFCPVSAALFFGSLLPLAALSPAPSLAVGIYGLGTALPVAALAALLAISATKAAAALSRAQTMQRWGMRVTGAILIAVGIWLALSDTFKVL